MSPTEYALVDGSGELVAVPFSAIAPSYGVGQNNLEIFRGVVMGLPYGEHYVYWRESQYLYVLCHGRDLVFNGTRFVGTGCTFVEYNTYYTSGGQPSFTIKGPLNLDLVPGNYLVYSDLDSYPRLLDREEVFNSEATLLCLCVCVLFYLLSRLRSSLRI